MPAPANAAEEIMNPGSGESTRYFGFPTVGTTITGILESIDKIQGRDFDTGEPAFYPDGNPVMKFVITLRTDLRDDTDDDGRRAVWLPDRFEMKNALGNAIRAGGDNVPKPGATLTVRFDHLEGRRKVYAFTYTQGAGLAAHEITTPAPASGPADVSPADLERALAALKQQGLTSDATQPPF